MFKIFLAVFLVGGSPIQLELGVATQVAASKTQNWSEVASGESYATHIPTKSDLFPGEEMAVERQRYLDSVDKLNKQKEEQKRLEEERLAQEAKLLEEQRIADQRASVVSSLNMFFEDNGARPLGEEFLYASEVYDVPLGMLVGISVYETGWFNSDIAINQNNFGGLKCNDRALYCAENGFAAYSSAQSGILDKAYLLSNHYIQNGMTTLPQIQPVYAPDFENDGSAWVFNISKIWGNMETYMN